MKWIGKILTVVLLCGLTTTTHATLSKQQLKELRSTCTSDQRHFSLSPELPVVMCMIIDSFHSYASDYSRMQERHQDSLELTNNRQELLQAVLTQLDYLATHFKANTLGYPANMNQQTRGVMTKNMVARDLVLLHFLLKEESVAGALSTDERTHIVQTMIALADSLGGFLYSYDMMTAPCPENSRQSCPRLLFMAPVMWTDILHRLARTALFSEQQITQLQPFVNNALEAHAQAAFGIPLYIRVYDPRTVDTGTGRYMPMDFANLYYQETSERWGIETDWHQDQFSAASLKMWGYMRNNPNFRFSLRERMTYSDDSHRYAERSWPRLAELLAKHQKPSRSAQLVAMPSFRIEMYYGIGNRTETEKGLNLMGLFDDDGANAVHTYEAYNQRPLPLSLD